MKSINAKRIAAVAASLLMGIAVAGQGVTFGNIPIINSAGQPVVQIVVGSTAMPSDGVVAANIAAAIGSLAHTSQNITATVNGRSGVSCVVTTPTCTLSNQQVWLGEKGLVVAPGAYSFTALIGSVLNGGVLNPGNVQLGKFILGAATNYVYPDVAGAGPFVIATSPNAPSAYEGVGTTVQSTVIANTNGGGMAYHQFTNTTASQDNLVRLSNSQVSGLLSSSGPHQESEFIWLGGFPVYNQNSNVSNFALLDTQVAYQVQFGKPITENGTSAPSQQFSLLGQNWTVYNFNLPVVGSTSIASNVFYVGTGSNGGNVTLAQASTPLTTVYVGQNITSGPFTVVLNDLSYPNSNGLANAALSVYKNGVLANVTSVGPAQLTCTGVLIQHCTVNASGTLLYIYVPQTFPGLYAYQKWAKIQLYSSTFTVGSGVNFNPASNGNQWLSLLRWTTNTSTVSTNQKMFNANAALQSIILYRNESQATMLTPGQSISVIGNPAVWKVNFVGDTLGTPGSGNTNFDQLAFTTSSNGGVTYQNAGGSSSASATSTYTFSTLGGATSGASGAVTTINTSVVKEAVNYFTVTSSLPNAFSVSASSGATAPTSNLQTLNYNLDSYKYTAYNVINSGGNANVLTFTNGGLYVTLTNGGLNGNYVTSSNPLNVQLTGYRSGQTSPSTQTVSFQSFGTQVLNGVTFTNLTDISLGAALPYPGVSVAVYESAGTNQQYAAGAVVSNTMKSVTAGSSNTVTLSIPYNYLAFGNTETLTASTSNTIAAANTLQIYVNGALVANTATTTNTLTYTLTAIGSYTANAVDVADSANTITLGFTIYPNPVLLGTLAYVGPVVLYSVPSVSYLQAGTASSVTYTGENNNVNFALTYPTTLATPSNTAARAQYFTYTIPEITTGVSATPNANTIIGITNSSQILSSPMYWLNDSTTGSGSSVGYTSSQAGASAIQAKPGFRTERGSEVAAVSTTSLTYDEAKSLDGLQFVVGTGTGSNSSTTTKMVGPYGVGQATNIPNVTIAKVNATCTFSTTSCKITGLNNLTATPSATQAVVANPLNTAVTPLAVLDSQANNASTLIVVGSKYVNSVAAQIQAQNPSFDSSFGPTSVAVTAFGTNRILVAGYTAAQTVQAGNEFIQNLLASAST